MRRTMALALATGLVCVLAGCGKYGPPRRYPEAPEASAPVVEQPIDAEAAESEQ
jgi:predicted small lipoprotein YifL